MGISFGPMRISGFTAVINSVPGAPTIGTATATGSTTATVAFTAPASNGGQVITSYTAVSTPGNITGTLSQAGSGTITVTGLTAGTSYTFTVYATNSVGNSANSSASNSITTFAAPVNTVAPVVSGTATVGQVLSTTNGTWTGTATITYTYQWQRNGVNIATATASTYTLVVADIGNPIRCVVTGTNSYGNSSANSNATANVIASVPGAPTIGAATATSGTTATVAFTAPASNGGATITSYTAVSTPGSITGTLSQAGSGTITVSGLTLGTSYTFTVYATNSVGNSANSSASNSITTPAELYWEAFSYSAGASDAWAYTTPDASGNILLSGNSQLGGGLIQKYSGAGSSLTQQFSALPGYYETDDCNPTSGFAFAVAYDSSNNLYVTGGTGITGLFALAKYNSSGTLIDKKSFNNSATGYGISIDSSSNIIVSGNGGNGTFLHKYNSSYTLQWRRTFSNSEQGTWGKVRSVVNTSTNVTYMVVSVTPANAGCGIIAVDSTGATLWARKLTQSGGGDINGMDIKLDSSGNVYVAVTCFTLQKAVVAKYDSSGTIQWQRSLSDASIDFAWGVAVDASANVYLLGTRFVAKWNSSGTIQWQRVFGAQVPSLRSIAISGSSYYAVGSMAARAVLFVLPTDGSKTGTFPTLATY